MKRVALLFAAAALLASPALAERVRHDNLVVNFGGGISPKRLPRHGSAPIGINISGKIQTTDGLSPPQLRHISVLVNRNGRLDARGLPTCQVNRIEGRTSAQAMRFCGGALVGRGKVAAEVALPEQSPFPSAGNLLAFNGRHNGRRAVIAHIFGEKPLPITLVVPFRIGHAGGRYGAKLTADLPVIASDWGYVRQIKISLSRQFRHKGRSRSYLNAGCPAPKGFPGALFPLAKTRFEFANGDVLSSVLTRECKVRGG